MGFDVRLPNITATTDAGQLAQIKSYLYQLAGQLQWAMNSREVGTSQPEQRPGEANSTGRAGAAQDGQSSFNEIKSLIIKSADIVDAYYEKMQSRLSGEYVAQSQFGEYAEKTALDILETSTGIKQNFEHIQKITSDIDVINEIIANAYINSGLLGYDSSGVPIYGLEIGEKNVIDVGEVFQKYARFTSDRLSFYDRNNTEVAYISDYKQFITNAEVTGTLTLGRYLLETDSGLAFRWI